MHRKTPDTISPRHYFVFAALTLLAVSFISACEPAEKQYNYSIFAFGTLIDVTLYSSSSQQAEAAFAQLQKDFDRYHQHWSPWTDGDLAKINKQLAATTTGDKVAITIPPHLLPIIKASIILSEQTEHYFNPAIGNLINLWQFHKYQDDDIEPPDDSLIQALITRKPQMSDLSLHPDNTLINTNPAVALNFGAYAKGYAIEQEILQLKKFGIKNAVINAGGDLSVIGQHGNRDWVIGIRHPRKQQILASVEVKSDESVFTSGDYERLYYYRGQRYHHILDPATGYPTQDAQSVTVIHADAGLADAAATALFVAGSEHWQKVAKKLGLRYVMLIDATGTIHLTKAMQARIKFLHKSPTTRIILSEPL